MYAYCLNNPILNVDTFGNKPLPWWANLLIGLGVLAVLAVATIVTAGIADVGLGTAFGLGFGIGSAAGTAIATGGSAAATMALMITSSAFAGAVIGGFTSAAASAVMLACTGASGDDIWNTVCTSFMFGAILGGFSGGINKVPFASQQMVNIGTHMGVNTVMSLGMYLGQTAYTDGNLDKVSIGGVFLSLIGGASAGYLPTKPLLSGYYNYLLIQGAMFFDFVHDIRKRYLKK